MSTTTPERSSETCERYWDAILGVLCEMEAELGTLKAEIGFQKLDRVAQLERECAALREWRNTRETRRRV